MKRWHSAQKINKNATAFNSPNSYTLILKAYGIVKSLDLQFC